MTESAQAQIGARDSARSSGQALARVSDSHSGVEHYHTPPGISGSGMSAVSKPSGPDMADASTCCDISDWLAAWFAGLEAETDTSCTDSSGRELWR
eukprot:2969192-Pleurochrysis_carterae.AAC.1